MPDENEIAIDSHRDGFVHNANQVESIYVRDLGCYEFLEDAQKPLYLVVLGNHFGSAQNQSFPKPDQSRHISSGFPERSMK